MGVEFIPLLAAGVGAGASVYGSQLSAESQQQVSQQQLMLDLYKFENLIQTRVKDAQAAGIAPTAALGLPGTAPSNVTFPGKSQAGVAGMEGLGNMVREYGEIKMRQMEREETAAHNRRVQEERRTEEAHRVRMDNAQLQMHRSRLDLAQRRFALYEKSLNAQAHAQRGRRGAFVKWYDNRDELGPLGDKEFWAPHEQLAESGEGTFGAAMTAGSNLEDQVVAPILEELRMMFKEMQQMQGRSPLQRWLGF